MRDQQQSPVSADDYQHHLESKTSGKPPISASAVQTSKDTEIDEDGQPRILDRDESNGDPRDKSSAESDLPTTTPQTEFASEGREPRSHDESELSASKPSGQTTNGGICEDDIITPIATLDCGIIEDTVQTNGTSFTSNGREDTNIAYRELHHNLSENNGDITSEILENVPVKKDEYLSENNKSNSENVPSVDNNTYSIKKDSRNSFIPENGLTKSLSNENNSTILPQSLVQEKGEVNKDEINDINMETSVTNVSECFMECVAKDKYHDKVGSELKEEVSSLRNGEITVEEPTKVEVSLKVKVSQFITPENESIINNKNEDSSTCMEDKNKVSLVLANISENDKTAILVGDVLVDCNNELNKETNDIINTKEKTTEHIDIVKEIVAEKVIVNGELTLIEEPTVDKAGKEEIGTSKKELNGRIKDISLGNEKNSDSNNENLSKDCEKVVEFDEINNSDTQDKDKCIKNKSLVKSNQRRKSSNLTPKRRDRSVRNEMKRKSCNKVSYSENNINDTAANEVVKWKGYAEPMSKNYENLGLPMNLVIKTSRKQDGKGMKLEGVFAKNKIKSGTVFGPYQGNKIVNPHQYMDFDYIWEIIDLDTGELLFYIDASIPGKGRWMRYIRCAKNKAESNLVSEQNDIEILYRSTKCIKPKEEMLLYYPGVEKRINLAKDRIQDNIEPIIIKNSPEKLRESPGKSPQINKSKKSLPLPVSLPSYIDDNTGVDSVVTPVQNKRTSPSKRGQLTPRKRPPLPSSTLNSDLKLGPCFASPASLSRTKRDLAVQLATPQTDSAPSKLRTSARLLQRLTAYDTKDTDMPANAIISQHGNAMPVYLSTTDPTPTTNPTPTTDTVDLTSTSPSTTATPISYYGYSNAETCVANYRRQVTSTVLASAAIAAASAEPDPKDLIVETLASKSGVVSLPTMSAETTNGANARAGQHRRGLVRPVMGVVLVAKKNKAKPSASTQIKENEIVSANIVAPPSVDSTAIDNPNTNTAAVPAKKTITTTPRKPIGNKLDVFDDNSNYIFSLLPLNHCKHKTSRSSYICDICGYLFNTANTLKTHFMRLHVDYRYMDDASKIRCHIQVATKYGAKESDWPYRAFSCCYCNIKSLCSRRDLCKHVAIAHLHTSYNPDRVPSDKQRNLLSKLPRFITSQLDAFGRVQRKTPLMVAHKQSACTGIHRGRRVLEIPAPTLHNGSVDSPPRARGGVKPGLGTPNTAGNSPVNKHMPSRKRPSSLSANKTRCNGGAGGDHVDNKVSNKDSGKTKPLSSTTSSAATSTTAAKTSSTASPTAAKTSANEATKSKKRKSDVGSNNEHSSSSKKKKTTSNSAKRSTGTPNSGASTSIVYNLHTPYSSTVIVSSRKSPPAPPPLPPKTRSPYGPIPHHINPAVSSSSSSPNKKPKRWTLKQAAATSKVNLAKHIMGTQKYLDVAELYCRADFTTQICHRKIKEKLNLAKFNLPSHYDLDDALANVPVTYDLRCGIPYHTTIQAKLGSNDGNNAIKDGIVVISSAEKEEKDAVVKGDGEEEKDDLKDKPSEILQKEDTKEEGAILEKVVDKKEYDVVKKEGDVVEKEADVVEKETDVVEKEVDVVGKEAGVVEKEEKVDTTTDLGDSFAEFKVDEEKVNNEEKVKDEEKEEERNENAIVKNEEREEEEMKVKSREEDKEQEQETLKEGSLPDENNESDQAESTSLPVSPFKGWMNGLIKNQKSPIKKSNSNRKCLDFNNMPLVEKEDKQLTFFQALELVPITFICKRCQVNNRFKTERELFDHHTTEHKRVKPSNIIVLSTMVPEWKESTNSIGTLGIRSKNLPIYKEGENPTFNCCGCDMSLASRNDLHKHVVSECASTADYRAHRAHEKENSKLVMVDVDPRNMGKQQQANKPYKVKTVKGRKRKSKPATQPPEPITEDHLFSSKRRYFDLDNDSSDERLISLPSTKQKIDLNKKKRPQFASFYDPTQHKRRRECTTLIGLHSCGGCKVQFETLTLLEKHVKHCVHKDKLQKLRAIAANESIYDSDNEIAFIQHNDSKPHLCIYCNVKNYKSEIQLYRHISTCQGRKKLIAEEGDDIIDADWEKRYSGKEKMPSNPIPSPSEISNGSTD